MNQSIASPQEIRIRRLLTLLISLAVIALALLVPQKTAAVNKTWIGSGNWSDPNNWSPVGVPQSGDAVTFNGTSTNNATIDAAGPQGVNISVFTISINSGYSGTITVADTVNISVSHITINSGTLNVPPTSSGTLTVVENFTLNGGTFNHAGGTVVFVGTNSQILLTPSTVTFNNLTVNKVDGHNITIADPSKTVRIINTLTLTEGKLSANFNSMFKAENAVNIASGFGNQSGGGSAVLLIRDEQDGINTRTILLPPGASLPSITLDDPDVTLNPSGPGTVAAQSFILHRGTVALGATNFDVGFVSGSSDANYTQTGGSFTIGSGNFTTQQFGLFQLSGSVTTTFTATSGNLNLFRSNCTLSGGVLTTPSGVSSVTTIGANFNYNFTQSGGVFNGNGTVEINGRFTLSNGTFNATPGTTSFGFVFDHQSGTFNHGGASSTIVLDGEHPAYSIFAPGAQGTETFHNLTVNLLNGQLSLNDDTWVINGTLRLINGTVISTGPGKFQSQGDVVIESTADGGSANITFTGSANQTYTNNGGANLTGTWTINKLSGALILATNLNVGTSVLNLTDGTINTGLVSAPTTADKEGAPNGPAVVGNMLDTHGSTVNIGATFDGGTATIAFTGSGARTVTMPAGVVMPNVLLNAANATLTTSGAGTVTMGNFEVQAGTANLSAITADINGAFTQTGGTFNAPTGSLLLAHHFTHTAGGTFNANNGTFIFDGPTAQTVDVNGTETFGTLTLNKTGTNNNDVLNIAAGDTLIAANMLDLQNGEIWGGTVEVLNAMTVATTFADIIDSGNTGTIAITGSSARTITLPAGTRLPNLVLNAPNVTLDASGSVGFFIILRDLTVQDGTASLGNHSVRINNLTISGGIFNAPTNINLVANFTHISGGTFNHNNGFFATVGPTSTFDVNGTETFFRLGFFFGTAVNLSGDTLIVIEQLTLDDGTVNNGFIEAQKDVSLESRCDGGDATVNVVGAATRTITVPGGASLPNFVLNAPNVTMTGGTASSSFATFRSMNLQAGTIQPGDVPWRFSQFYTQSGGNFASGNKDIDFDGDFSITGESAIFRTSQTNTFYGGNLTVAPPAEFIGNPGMVTFDGSSTQNIEVGEFEIFTAVTIAPADGVALNITSGDTLFVEGPLTLTNGQVNAGTFDVTSVGLTVANGFDGGNANIILRNNPVSYSNGGGVNPTGTWTIPGTLNLASDLDLSNSTAALVLQNGIINTGGHTVNAGERPITRTGSFGYVNGNLQRSFTTTGLKTFNLGFGGSHSPVSVDVTALGVSPSSLKIGNRGGTHPALDPLASLFKYWTIAETGDLTATLTFVYSQSDINGDESLYRIFRITGGVPVNSPNNCPGTPCVNTTANTATIAGVSQFSDWSLGEPGTPTAVDLVQFNAVAYDKGTLLEWQTGTEADNLGFNLYREEGGKRALINHQLIAGSALRVDSTLRSGDAYRWWDNGATTAAGYWLEDIDLKGQSTLHGPYYTKQTGEKQTLDPNATLLSEVAAHSSQQDTSRQVDSRTAITHGANALATQANAQATLPAGAAAKIQIKREGWYRITQPELGSVGFNTKTDPRSLQLFVDGREVPILVRGEQDGRFDADDSVEFYGLALDSPYTDVRTYWLSAGSSPGMRVKQVISQGESTTSQAFTATVERRDRTIYFSALRNGEQENFFGAVLAGSPVDQLLTLSHLSSDSREAALEVGLQGVTMQQHSVDVEINGVHAGLLNFQDQLSGIGRFSLPRSLLRDGANTVRFTPIGGPGDVSLVDFIRISYQRSYIADNNLLRLTAPGAEHVSVDGFTSSSIRVVDVTDSNSPHEIVGIVEKRRAGYAVQFTAGQGGERSLLAFTTEQRPLRLGLDQPSNLRDNPVDFIIVTCSGLADSLEALAGLRRTQGLSVAVVDIEDIYDEFNFGQKSPAAVRDYLSYAISNWKKKPRFVLLAGDASVDPKNYLGFGEMDLVPTKLVDTGFMETASDDWFADFDDNGVADMAIGRLPARTADEIAVMIKKILAYTEASPVASALLVADQNDSFDFEQASAELRRLLPSSFAVEEIKRAQMDAQTAKARLFEALARGQQVVNYVGHGSAQLWRGNLLTVSDARELRNAQLPVFVMMSCLNGYFQDVVVDSLSEALLKAEHGGAVAVWASSGLTYPQGQAQMNRALYEALFAANGGGFAKNAGSRPTLGEAVQQAKAAISDTDVRRTWILLGDPTLRLK